jgi:hypothetical protein
MVAKTSEDETIELFPVPYERENNDGLWTDKKSEEPPLCRWIDEAVGDGVNGNLSHSARSGRG